MPPRPIIVSVIFHFNIQMLKRSTGFPSIEKTKKLKQRGGLCFSQVDYIHLYV
ncbi:Hypothetical protein ACI5QL_02331 [Bacillus velezensis]